MNISLSGSSFILSNKPLNQGLDFWDIWKQNMLVFLLIVEVSECRSSIFSKKCSASNISRTKTLVQLLFRWTETTPLVTNQIGFLKLWTITFRFNVEAQTHPLWKISKLSLQRLLRLFYCWITRGRLQKCSIIFGVKLWLKHYFKFIYCSLAR